LVSGADLLGNVSVPTARDVYNDFLDKKDYVRWDPSKVKWKLLHTATPSEYKLWEETMERGFALCNLKLDDTMACTLVTMHVDERIYISWSGTRAKGIPREARWEDYMQFLRARFRLKSTELDKTVVSLLGKGLAVRLPSVAHHGCRAPLLLSSGAPQNGGPLLQK
jgi:hypothetical protein